MNVTPIPDRFLGDEFYLCTPTADGWSETHIYNVRVEKTSIVSAPTASSPRDISEITVWYDYVNSYPSAEFTAGTRAKYHGEIFEITEVKFYRAEELHRCRIKAVKIGGSYSDAN